MALCCSPAPLMQRWFEIEPPGSPAIPDRRRPLGVLVRVKGGSRFAVPMGALDADQVVQSLGERVAVDVGYATVPVELHAVEASSAFR